MRLKLLSCNVFLREACLCVAGSPHLIDIDFTELGEHVHSDLLRASLQGKIDVADASGIPYDAILLLFGLCGNATVGLHAGRVPLVIPRAHDCCTILLGARSRFIEHFGDHPSTPFSSSGYLERGEYFLRIEDGEQRLVIGDGFAALVAEYGEEDARYIWETMHPEPPGGEEAVFIDLPDTAHLGHAARFQAQAEAEGRAFRCLDGDIRLIRRLIDGAWDGDDFLIVPPGQAINGVYDWQEVMRADGAAPADAPTAVTR